MKTALILSGNPRFSEDFDSQLENLQNSDVHIFFAFWRRPEGVDPKLSPNWCNLKTAGEVFDRVTPHLPARFHIYDGEVMDESEIDPPPRDYVSYNSTPVNVWQQYNLLNIAHSWLKLYEPYDLVIRSRTDLGLSEPIDLELAHKCLLQTPNVIYTPNNQRYGYGVGFNDQFAIGLPETMNIYVDAVNHFDKLYDDGVKYNPEYLLQTHLQNNGIQWPETSWEIVRDPAHYVPIKHGKWDKI